MKKALKFIRGLLPLARRLNLPLRYVPFLTGLNFLWIAFEGISVALLLPIFELLRNGGTVEGTQLKGWHWDLIRDIAGYFGLTISLGLLLAVSFFFLLLRQIFNYANVYFHGSIARYTAHRIRRRTISGFLWARSAVQDEINIGKFANELTMELDRALSSLFTAMRGIGVLAQLSVYLFGMFLLSPPMTALSIAVLVILTFFIRHLLAAIMHTGAAITDANSQITGFIVERLQRPRLIRLSGTEKAESTAFAKLSRRHANEYIRHKRLTVGVTLIPEPITVGFGYLVLFIGSEIIGLSLEQLGLFVVVLIRLMPVLKTGIGEYNNVVGKWPAVARIDGRIKQIEKGLEEKGGDKPFVELEHGICYENISFQYPDSRGPALSDVNVTLPAHHISALVGASGAGKSTFVDLLPRLRDPEKGRILIDGTPITDFLTESLRAGIGFVPQQPEIFNISAAEHIRYGKEDATDAEVREAARLAGAIDFIEALPDGFDTLLGDGGKRLSGGQRQRLDIARALVRRAPVLILDEPTSALDAGAEGAFREALQALRRETKITVIVIAHRLSTIADADCIVVLQNGRVQSTGSHKDLMAEGGWYADAYRQQVNAREPARSNDPV